MYEGHTDVVRSISCDPSGQWLASGIQLEGVSNEMNREQLCVQVDTTVLFDFGRLLLAVV